MQNSEEVNSFTCVWTELTREKEEEVEVRKEIIKPRLAHKKDKLKIYSALNRLKLWL